MAIINFNYSKAIKQADQVDEIAREMRSLADRDLQNSVDGLSASWCGEASEQFAAYCGSTQSDLLAEAAKLQDQARRIREIARALREAEEAAKTQMQGGFGGGGF